MKTVLNRAIRAWTAFTTPGESLLTVMTYAQFTQRGIEKRHETNRLRIKTMYNPLKMGLFSRAFREIEKESDALTSPVLSSLHPPPLVPFPFVLTLMLPSDAGKGWLFTLTKTLSLSKKYCTLTKNAKQKNTEIKVKARAGSKPEIYMPLTE